MRRDPAAGDVAAAAPGSADAGTADGFQDRYDAGEQLARGAGTYDRRGQPAARGRELSPAQQQMVARLQARDAEVRAHEAAHQGAGGGMVGGASFSYQQGPDGRSYAIGGEVSISASAERDPDATVAKMQRVIAAALAPAQPSGQDLAVAAQANATMAQARAQAAAQGGEAPASGTQSGPAPGRAAGTAPQDGPAAADEAEARDGAAEEAAEGATAAPAAPAAPGSAATASAAGAPGAQPAAENAAAARGADLQGLLRARPDPVRIEVDPLPIWAVKAPAAAPEDGRSEAASGSTSASAAQTGGKEDAGGGSATPSAAPELPSAALVDHSPGRMRRGAEVDELYRRLSRGEVAGTVLDRSA